MAGTLELCRRLGNGVTGTGTFGGVTGAGFKLYNTVIEAVMLPETLRHRSQALNFKEFRRSLTQGICDLRFAIAAAEGFPALINCQHSNHARGADVVQDTLGAFWRPCLTDPPAVPGYPVAEHDPVFFWHDLHQVAFDLVGGLLI